MCFTEIKWLCGRIGREKREYSCLFNYNLKFNFKSKKNLKEMHNYRFTWIKRSDLEKMFNIFIKIDSPMARLNIISKFDFILEKK